MIDVDRLTKVFPGEHSAEVGRVAVDDLTFAVERGEVFGLLGPNGAGKTTTLRILATLLAPTSGTVRLGGYDVGSQPHHVRRLIGFVSSHTKVHDRLTPRETLDFFGRLHGLGGVKLAERIETILDRLDMRPFADRLGAHLSTGMRQRASIARALIHDPPILIFDEPTLGLDVLAARSVLDTIQQLKQDGKCIVYSTHIMREVERLCDRVGIMHEGRLLACGDVAGLCRAHNRSSFEDVFFHLIDHHRSVLRESPSCGIG